MKRIVSLVFATAAVFVLSGCGGGAGGGGGGGGAGGSSLVIDAKTPPSNTAFLSTVNLLNDPAAIEDICEVYSVPSSSATWGPNILAGRMVILPFPSPTKSRIRLQEPTSGQE